MHTSQQVTPTSITLRSPLVPDEQRLPARERRQVLWGPGRGRGKGRGAEGGGKDTNHTGLKVGRCARRAGRTGKKKHTQVDH